MMSNQRPSPRPTANQIAFALTAVLILVSSSVVATPLHADVGVGWPAGSTEVDLPPTEVAGRAQRLMDDLDARMSEHVAAVEAGLVPILPADADPDDVVLDAPRLPTVLYGEAGSDDPGPLRLVQPVADLGAWSVIPLPEGMSVGSVATGAWSRRDLPDATELRSPTFAVAGSGLAIGLPSLEGLALPGPFALTVRSATEAATLRLLDGGWVALETSQQQPFATRAPEGPLALTVGSTVRLEAAGLLVAEAPSPGLAGASLLELGFVLPPLAAGPLPPLPFSIGAAPASTQPSPAPDLPEAGDPQQQSAANPLNLPPLKPVNPPSGPTAGSTGLSYSFSTSAIDPEQGQVKHEFSWGDGTTTTTGFVPSGQPASASHVWTTPGTYRVRARAVDSSNAAGDWSDEASITLVTRPPNAPNAPVAPADGRTNLAQVFTFSGSDPDGDPIQFFVTWGDGSTSWTSSTPSGVAVQASHTYPSPGTYTVKASAKDQYNAQGPDSPGTSFPVKSRPPLKPSAPTGPTTGFTGVAVTYGATTTDPDGNSIRYTYQFVQGTSPAVTVADPTTRSSGAASSVSYTWTLPGTHKVRVVATDTYGETLGYSADKVVTISSRPPVVTLAPSGPASGETGLTYSYSAVATDPDGDQVRIRFDWGDGQSTLSDPLQASGTSITRTHAWSTPGTYSVHATGIDSWGQTGTASPAKSVAIVSRAPSTPQVIAAPTSGYINTQYPITVSSSDPDGNQVRYIFNYTGAPLEVSPYVASGSTYPTSHAWPTPGNHTFKVKAEDSYGRSSAWTPLRTVSIVNRLPDIPAPPTGPADARTNRPEAYTTVATDPDGNTLRYTFRWNQAGALSYDETPLVASGTPATKTHVWSVPGNHGVSTLSKDQYGATSAYSNPLLAVVQSQPPSPMAAPAGPAAAETGTVQPFTFSATDPDGDAVKYQVNWGDGVSPWTGFNASGQPVTLTHSWSASGTYSVTVTAQDAYGQTRVSPAATISLLSRGPLPVAAPTGPGAVTILEPADFTASATDPDGDAVRLTFDWGDGTPATQSGWVPSGTPVSLGHAWSTAGTKQVKVRAEESHGIVGAWSPAKTVTIVNLAPYSPLAPTMDLVHWGTYGNSGTTYSFRVAARDPEGHDVRYTVQWGDGATSQTGWLASGTEATLSHAWNVPYAQTYQVSTKAEDRHGAVGPWSPSLKFLGYPANTPPGAPSSLTGPPIVLGAATADFTAQGTDPNGDRVRYRLDWGDGTSSITGVVGSGQRATASHSWSAPGLYTVKARTEDHRGGNGTWHAGIAVRVHPAVFFSDGFDDGVKGGPQWQPNADPAITESGGALRIAMDQSLPVARRALATLPVAKSITGADGLEVRVDLTEYGTGLGPYGSGSGSGVRITNLDSPTKYVEIMHEGSNVYLRDSAGGLVSVGAATGTAPHVLSLFVDATGYSGSIDGGAPSATRAFTGMAGANNLQIEAAAVSKATTARQWTASFHSLEARPWVGGSAPTTPVQPTWPTAGKAEQPVRLLLKAADVDGTPLRMQVDWGDGTTTLGDWFPSSNATAGTIYADHTYTVTGAKSVKTRPIDLSDRAGPWSAARTFTVNPANRAPAVPQMPQGPTATFAKVLTTYTSVAVDPDADALTYEFHWHDYYSAEQVTTVSRPSGSVASASHAFEYPGHYPVTVVVRDSSGLESWSEEVVVTADDRPPNTPPAPTVVGTPVAGDVDLRVTPTDPDGDSVRLQWDVQIMQDAYNQDGYSYRTEVSQWGEPSGVAQESWQYQLGSPGQAKVRVRAIDENAGAPDTSFYGKASAWSPWTSFTIQYPVRSPASPEFTQVLGHWDGWAGIPYTFLLHSSDANGDALKFTVMWGDSTPAQETAWTNPDTSVYVTHTFAQPGQYQVLAWATDTTGRQSQVPGTILSGTQKMTVTAVPATSHVSLPPIAGPSTVLPAYLRGYWQEEINRIYYYDASHMVVTDPDPTWTVRPTTTAAGAMVQAHIECGVDRFASPWMASGTTYEFGCDTTPIRARAIDDAGHQGAYTATKHIAYSANPNNPPAAVSVVSGPTTFRAGESAILQMRAADPEGDQVRIHVDWGDGTTSSSALVSSNVQVSVPHLYESPGDYAVVAWATDLYDHVGPSATVRELKVEAVEAGVSYFQSFENNPVGWTLTDQWAVSSRRAYTGWSSLRFGNDLTGTYQASSDPALAHSGTATSPAITVAAGNPHLHFWSWHQVDPSRGTDVRKVQILWAANGTVAKEVTLGKESAESWDAAPKVIDLRPWVGKSVKIRFSFNTVTGNDNHFEGWYVDRLEIRDAFSLPDDAVFTATSPIMQETFGQDVSYASRSFDGVAEGSMRFDDGVRDQVVKTIRIDPANELGDPMPQTLQLALLARLPACATDPTAGLYRLLVNGVARPLVDLCPQAGTADPAWIRLGVPASTLINGYNTFELQPAGTVTPLYLAYEPLESGGGAYGREDLRTSQESSRMVQDGALLEGELVWLLEAARDPDAYTLLWFTSDVHYQDSNGQEQWLHRMDATAYFAQSDRNMMRLFWMQDEHDEVQRGWFSQTLFREGAYNGNDPAHAGPYLVADLTTPLDAPGYAQSPSQGTSYRWYDVEGETFDPATGAKAYTRFVQMVPMASAWPIGGPDSQTSQDASPLNWRLLGYERQGLCTAMGMQGGPHSHFPWIENGPNPQGHNCVEMVINVLDFPSGEEMGPEQQMIHEMLDAVDEVMENIDLLNDVGSGGKALRLMLLSYFVTFAATGNVFRWSVREFDAGGMPFFKWSEVHPDLIGLGLGAAAGPVGAGVAALAEAFLPMAGHMTLYEGTWYWENVWFNEEF